MPRKDHSLNGKPTLSEPVFSRVFCGRVGNWVRKYYVRFLIFPSQNRISEELLKGFDRGQGVAGRHHARSRDMFQGGVYVLTRLLELGMVSAPRITRNKMKYTVES